MEIITGYTGQNHIEAGDVQALLRGIMGAEQFHLLDTGMVLEPEIVDANTVKINSGDIIFQGVHCRIPYGEFDTVSIDNGSADIDRRDVIALRYEKDADTGEESVGWVYYKGESHKREPSVTWGSIEEGDLVAEVKIFVIKFDKMTITEIMKPAKTLTISSIAGKALNAEIAVNSKAEANDVFYKAGDTATLYYEPVCGEINSNKKTLRYFVPFAKVTKGVTKVTITAGNYSIKANNAVVQGARPLVDATKTVTLRPNGITIEITKSDGFSGSANAVCAVSGYATVKFSA